MIQISITVFMEKDWFSGIPNSETQFSFMANTNTKTEKKKLYIINFQADFPLVEKKIITQKNGEIQLLEVGDNIIAVGR